MTHAEPYTPATVALIRRRSRSADDATIAAELGWPVTQLHSIARKHSVDLTIAAVPPPAKPEPKLLHDSGTMPRHPDGIEWFKGSGRIVRHKAESLLTPAQSALFDLLLSRMRDGHDLWTTRESVPRDSGINYDSITAMRPKINGRLEGLALEIVGSGQRGQIQGGFRLVDLLKQEPTT